MSEFQKVLLEAIGQFPGSKADLAKKIKITPSHLSHLLAGKGSVSAEVCHRLAKITAMSPSKILRAAGKAEYGDLLEDLYGPAAERRAATREDPSRFTLQERQHIENTRKLPVRQRQYLFGLVDEIAKLALPIDEEPTTVVSALGLVKPRGKRFK